MDFPRKIYAIKHNVTNRVYVGSSHQVGRRIGSHLSRLRSHTHTVEDMQADFDKYGEKFTIMILDEISNNEELNKEYEYMLKYGSAVRGKGYNYNDTIYKKFAREQARKNEKELIDLIRNNENPQLAFLKAINIIASYLISNQSHHTSIS